MSTYRNRGPKFKVTEEVAKQYEVVSDGIGKLTDMSCRGWHLIEDGCYKREMAGAAIIGGVFTTATIGVTKLVKKLWKKHKDKQESESK